ncbi:MAG: small, acid-soluble spore protein, alpha/beta type [Clostridia bacterium]|nr:small, acid-soluble spore protein, alpha/beta type [Clostridia bacterium]
MANSNSNRTLVPEAKESLNKFKYEVASDIAVKNIFDKPVSEATS